MKIISVIINIERKPNLFCFNLIFENISLNKKKKVSDSAILIALIKYCRAIIKMEI